MSSFSRQILRGLLAAALLAPWLAQAEPYLAVRYGVKCVSCHINPTGGGLRSSAGHAFLKGAIASNSAPEPLSDWSGNLFDDRLRLGGDLRTSSVTTDVPGKGSTRVGGTEQARLYADLQLVKDYLGVYLDQQVAPGKALRQEGYVRVSTPGLGWYAKAGQFYLPFGWRLQDSLAFVRQLSGVSMTVPDKGVEIGMERDEWSAQIASTSGAGNGRQLTGQVTWLQSWGRVGAALARVNGTGGDRQAWGLFAGTTTGPVAWLGEVDLVSDSGYPEGTRKQVATLLEANWLVQQGHNLKLTSEYLDPDRKVANDYKSRLSLVYEYTPLAFMQLRAGWRKFGGIPQNALDNRRQLFAELHAMF